MQNSACPVDVLTFDRSRVCSQSCLIQDCTTQVMHANYDSHSFFLLPLLLQLLAFHCIYVHQEI